MCYITLVERRDTVLVLVYLFGEVIVNDESVHSVVSEVFSHGTAGVGGQVLEWSCI